MSRAKDAHFVTFSADGSYTTTVRIHEDRRPRFWYFVLANCHTFDDIDFEMRLLNSKCVCVLIYCHSRCLSVLPLYLLVMIVACCLCCYYCYC